MNPFRKLDAIPPPYSTLLALIIPTLLGIYFIVRQGDSGQLGVGIITGAFFALTLKKSAEVSDRAVRSRILGVFRRRNTDSAD